MNENDVPNNLIIKGLSVFGSQKAQISHLSSMVQAAEEHHVGVPIEVVCNTIGLSHLCKASEGSQEHLETGNHLGCAAFESSRIESGSKMCWKKSRKIEELNGRRIWKYGYDMTCLKPLEWR